jgi:hypothetical protein
MPSSRSRTPYSRDECITFHDTTARVYPIGVDPLADVVAQTLVPAKLSQARGVDSCQALLNAFDGIHYTLAQSGLQFTWIDIENETGFPRSVPYSFGPDFAARINRYIDRQLNRFIKDAKRRIETRTGRRGAKRPSSKPPERASLNRRGKLDRQKARRSAPIR